VALHTHLLSPEVAGVRNRRALPPLRGTARGFHRVATEATRVAEFDQQVAHQLELESFGKSVRSEVVVRESGESPERLVLGEEREDVRKVEGRVRPVEAITENEEFEAVGLGVEGSRRGDDGGDAIASKKGLIDILERRQKIEKDEEDDEDLHF
jgi:hypothetical protein